MGQELKCITFYVQKHIAILATCCNLSLVRDKPLGDLTWRHWVHPSIFHAAAYLLNWYKMACMANVLHRLIWVKFMSMLSMYVQSGTHRHFHWRIITVLTQNPTVLMFVAPQTLANICRNMGICRSFRAVAARGKHPGFMLLPPRKYAHSKYTWFYFKGTDVDRGFNLR